MHVRIRPHHYTVSLSRIRWIFITVNTPHLEKIVRVFNRNCKEVVYEGVSKRFRTESITKQTTTTTTTTTTNTRWEATNRVTAAKFTGLTHKIAIQLHLVAESCTICSSRSRRPVRKLLDTPSYVGEDQYLKHWRDVILTIFSISSSTLLNLIIGFGMLANIHTQYLFMVSFSVFTN
jgi:hypothetical protein